MSEGKEAMRDRAATQVRELPAGLPHVACILLWYPLFTQPFIFREIEGLKERLPLSVYSLYGRNTRHCSAEMLAQADRVRTFGAKALPGILAEMLRQMLTHPLRFCRLAGRSLFRRWPSLEIFGENLWAFACGLSLGRLLKDAGFDMIYAPWPRGTATAAWVASTISGIPFAVAARGDNLAPADPDLADKMRAALFIRANNAADRKRIEDFDGADAQGRTELVYNSLTLLPSGEAPGEDGKREIAEQGPVRLLALGRFDVTKGFDVLLKACGILRDQGLDFALTLAGGGGRVMGLGNLESSLRDLRAKLGLEQRVAMPGLVSHDELPRLLRRHDIFVAPCVIDPAGRRDGIPNTVIEAMSYGLPVIASNVNALPEVVRDGETGLTVAPNDPEALARAIARLAASPAEAKAMGRAGAALARDMFDPGANSRRLAEIFMRRLEWKDPTCAA